MKPGDVVRLTSHPRFVRVLVVTEDRIAVTFNDNGSPVEWYHPDALQPLQGAKST